MHFNDRNAHSYFRTITINRLSHKRRENDWIVSQLPKKSTRFVLIWQNKNLFARDEIPQPIYLSYKDIQPLLNTANHPILLGQKDDTIYFALNLPSEFHSSLFSSYTEYDFKDIKLISPLLSPEDCSLLAYARSMTYWHQSQNFCGHCGSQTQSIEAGFVKQCTNDQCKQLHFPRVDPSIIVLVTYEQFCLLGRQRQWQKRTYSTLAGFVEPGESLEDAIVREVFEEVGVKVENIKYFASDPWPFPTSLMLGFTACAESKEITIDKHELEDAAWFTREQLKHHIAQENLKLPMKSSIAFRLIKAWYESGNNEKLDE